MTNALEAGDSDMNREPDDGLNRSENEEEQPGIIASVGSGALGSVDVEPQTEPRPDNDGETVEDE
jgi:hypothetical protein